MYNGPANKCMDYIITIGFKRPIHITPADYFLDVIECVEEDEEEKEPSNNKSSNSANNRSSIMSNASASASSAVASVTSPVTKRGSERGSVVPLSSPNLSALVSSYGKAGSIMGTSIANAGGKNGPSQATIAANRKQRMLFLANRWKQYTKVRYPDIHISMHIFERQNIVSVFLLFYYDVFIHIGKPDNGYTRSFTPC